VLLRLAYLGLTNTFDLLRLLPMGNRDKGIEILVLRQQIAVLQRQLGGTWCGSARLTGHCSPRS
jgi:putative transposase